MVQNIQMRCVLVFVLSLLYTVGNCSSVYRRTYLHELKRATDEKIEADWIHIGITYIENTVIAAAKQGLTNYTTRQFSGCEAVCPIVIESTKETIHKNMCENIINRIKTLAAERFPDSEITYNGATGQYTLNWA